MNTQQITTEREEKQVKITERHIAALHWAIGTGTYEVSQRPAAVASQRSPVEDTVDDLLDLLLQIRDKATQ